MISQIGKVSLEAFKSVKVTRKEEIDGEIKDNEVDATIRFDFGIPMGAPYDLVFEVISELKEEISKMQEASKKLNDDRLEKEAKAAEQEEATGENITENSEVTT